MIDFKKELLKFKPVRTIDDVQDGIVTGEIDDIGEMLQYIAGREPEKAAVPKPKHGGRSGAEFKE